MIFPQFLRSVSAIFLLAVVFTNFARAQGVPVSFQGAAYTPAVNNGATIEPAELYVDGANMFLPTTPGATAYDSLSLFGVKDNNLAGSFSTDSATVLMEVGKSYPLSASTFESQYTISWVKLTGVAPAGYVLVIDDLPRNTAQASGSTHVFMVKLTTATNPPPPPPDDPQPPDNPPQDPSTLIHSGSNGGINWQVSLGGLRNGESAGALTLVDAGLANDWTPLATPAGLQYGSTADEIVVLRSGLNLRQVLANQLVADIVTSAEDSALTATQYEIRLYDPSQATGSGTDVRTFAATAHPFMTYRVELGDTLTSLKITSTTREANGTAIRSTVSTIARSGTAYPNYIWTSVAPTTSGETALTEEVTTSSTDSTSGLRQESVVVRVPGAGGAVATQLTKTFKTFSWGEERTVDSLGTTDPQTTTYDFYDDTAHPGAKTHLKSVSSNSGAWEAYEYVDETSTALTPNMGSVKRRHRPYGNLPAAIPANLATNTSGEITSYEYTADSTLVAPRPTLIETRIDGTLSGKTVIAYTDLGSINGSSVVQAVRDDYSGSDALGSPVGKLTTTTKFFKEDAADTFLRGLPYSIVRPDGVKVSYAYEQGSFDETNKIFSAVADGVDTRISVITGVRNDTGSGMSVQGTFDLDDVFLVGGKSTQQITILNARAQLRRTETYVWAPTIAPFGWSRVAHADYSTDAFGHVSGSMASNATSTSAAYTGSQKASETDASGVKTTFAYDVAGRVKSITKENGPKTELSYDAAGRVTGTTVSSPGTVETISSSRTFDDAGRLKSETPAGLGATDYAYTVASRQRKITTPDTATRTETYQLDGRLEKIEGSGVVPQYYTYACLADGSHSTIVRSGAADSTRLQTTSTDWLGRVTKTVAPGFAVTERADFVSERFYETGTGRLVKTTNTGYAPTIYEYDGLGNVVRSGLDIDRTGTVGLVNASTDRITEQDTALESYLDKLWFTTTVRTYLSAATTGLPIIVSISRQRVGAFPAADPLAPNTLVAESRVTDIEGNEVTTLTTINRATKTLKSAKTGPCNCSTQEEVIIDGLYTSLTTLDGLTFKTTYDALSRKYQELDSRKDTAGNPLATTYAYVNGSARVESVTDSAGRTVSFAKYDTSGRTKWVRNADSKYTRFKYNARGQLTHQWGGATYPVAYTYDPTYGDRTAMTTYQTGDATTVWDQDDWPAAASEPTGNTTNWVYDTPTALLHKKIDAQKAGSPQPARAEVVYDYTVRGQVYTRTGARGIITTFGYDADTSELRSTSYSDGTPTVSALYNRLGQTTSVTDATGSRAFTYDTDNSRPWRLASETLPTFFGTARTMNQLYENTNGPDGTTFGATQAYTVGRLKGRAVGFDLKNGATTELHQHATFTNLTRFVGITSSGAGLPTRDFAYDFTPNSRLVAGYIVDGTGFAVARGYEPTRDLLTSIDATWTAGAPAVTSHLSRFDYTYNALGQRATAQQSGTAFADYGSAVFNAYGYNARGELESARMYGGATRTVTAADADYPGRRFEYRYDAIGNRQTAGATGTASDDAFTANALNQYDSRQNKSVTVSGTAAASAQVAVQVAPAEGSAGPVARQDSVWAATLTPANSGGPKAGTAQVYSAQLGTGGAADTAAKGTKAFLAMPALETLTYDLDGNLKTDGRWVYEYDAENRLRQMDTSAATRTLFGVTWQRITFTYDYSGRRVEKKVATTVDGVNFAPGVWRRFIYDGWNLIAELDQLAGGTLARSYVWGLDVSGSLSAAGGVGALLQINDHPATKTWLPTYDGNGNVVSLVNSATGSLGAIYEYNPFGELIRNETRDPAAAGNPFRHATRYRDEETGLYYYGRRYYSASLGRWISRDPIEERGGLNLYGFVRNNAISRWDYLGLVDETVPLDPFFVNGKRWYDPWGDFGGGGGGGGFGGGGSSEDRSEPLPPEPPENPKCPGLRDALKGALVTKDGYLSRSGPVEGAPDVERMSDEQIRGRTLDPESFRDPLSGFYAAMYLDHSTNTFSVVMRGTEMNSWSDWITNVIQETGNAAVQYRQARDLGAQLGRMSSGNIMVYGHSLGSGLAVVFGLAAGADVITYNPVGVSRGQADALGIYLPASKSQVTAYSVPGEILSQIINRIPGLPGTDGKRVLLPYSKKLSFFGLNLHGIENVIEGLRAALKENDCK